MQIIGLAKHGIVSMKLYEAGTVLLIVVISAAAIGILSTKLFKMKDDNLIEEASEAAIEQVTGYDVDLTPESAEH